MSEICKRVCGTCRHFARDPECESLGVCWDSYRYDTYVAVDKDKSVCECWVSVADDQVGGDTVFVLNFGREELDKRIIGLSELIEWYTTDDDIDWEDRIRKAFGVD